MRWNASAQTSTHRGFEFAALGEGHGRGFANHADIGLELLDRRLYMANCHSSGDWQFKQPVAMALPTVILKVGCLRFWAAHFLSGRVAG